jgi:threonine dehydratase
VSDDEIVAAMKLIMERMKVPAGGVGGRRGQGGVRSGGQGGGQGQPLRHSPRPVAPCCAPPPPLKVVVEPSGAAGLAAALSPAFAASPKLSAARRVGVILCGGNLDFGARGFWEGWAPAG